MLADHKCGSVQCWQRTDAGFFFLMASLHRIPASEDAFYEHIRCILVHIMFFTTMLVLSCVFSLFSVPCLNTLTTHTTNQLPADVANNFHCTSHKNGEMEVEMVRAAPPSNRRCFQHPHFVGQLQSASAVLPSQCIHGATLNADTS